MNHTFSTKRPYIILPKLIEQPTWGGNYICRLKKWHNHSNLSDKKIGQSYELHSEAKLLLNIMSSDHKEFTPDVGTANDTSVQNASDYKEYQDFLVFSHCTDQNPEEFLGPTPQTKSTSLLIKLNHAAGNSFQLHIRPHDRSDRWQPKAESWYFIEDGSITCGLNKDKNVKEYEATCRTIEKNMQELSRKILENEITLQHAKNLAKIMIKDLNPSQYVNSFKMKKNSLLDLSAGGIHHSWEQDSSLAFGNVIYEVQQDIMDPMCTIRSFDQGKIKDDGTIRAIQIDDYFQFIDLNPFRNDIQNLAKTQTGANMLKTANYSLDIMELSQIQQIKIGGSYHHLFVRNGKIKVETKEGSVIVTQGHSCFIPYNVGSYVVVPQEPTVVLKTYIE